MVAHAQYPKHTDLVVWLVGFLSFFFYAPQINIKLFHGIYHVQ